MHFTQYVVLALFLSNLVNSAAHAGENGTYRAGTPYQTIQSRDAQACKQQCHGDAQCKGWNFISLDQQGSNTGICEFNSQFVKPTLSAISISGDNVSALKSSQIQSGKTHTIRVGRSSPSQASALPPQGLNNFAGAVSSQQSAQNQLNPHLESDLDFKTRLPRQFSTRTHLLQHALDHGPQQASAPTQPPSPTLPPSQLPYAPAPTIAYNTPAPFYHSAPHNYSSHNQATRASQPQPLPTRSVYTEQPTGIGRHQHQVKLRHSLLGTLDGVQDPQSPTQHSLHNPTLHNPNAPIATVRSVPLRPVQSSPLNQPW